jgi:hypothetical protein
MTETLTVNDLTFHVVRSSRRKTAEISVERDGQLVVRAPSATPADALQRYAHKKRAWVYEKLATRALLVGTPPKREFVAGEGFPYLGRSYRLLLVDEQDAPLKLHEGRFRLRRRDAHRGREVLIAWYIDHARPWLEHRVAGWSERMGAARQAVHVRDLGYRWGSCGVSGLNFHWATITLPPAVVDYVIVHELAHLEHPDHGDPFWSAVERAMPNAKVVKAWLAERGGAHVV